MSEHQIERQALEYAAEILGGEAALAAKLGVTLATLKAWIGGEQFLPDGMLLQVADIILTAAREERA